AGVDGLGPALTLPELCEFAPEPALLGRDGVAADGDGDGRPGVLGTVTGGGAGVETGGVETGGVETGGVETGPTGVGTVTLGTETLGTETEGAGVIGPIPAAPAIGAATSRPETAAEMQRIFRDMVSRTMTDEKTYANCVDRL
ncbi:MAG: hypothetical protein ACRDNK_03600, partial [Solirubrobacteraceae bacterium]